METARHEPMANFASNALLDEPFAHSIHQTAM
jgi:hypothetical protein